MGKEFQKLMEKIAKAVEGRTISLGPKKAKAYENGTYCPFFSLIDRGGELLCMWCGNRRRPNKNGEDGDVEIVRFRRPELGFATDGQDPLSWDNVTLAVMRHFKLKL